jgi:hypothetical protein
MQSAAHNSVKCASAIVVSTGDKFARYFTGLQQSMRRIIAYSWYAPVSIDCGLVIPPVFGVSTQQHKPKKYKYIQAVTVKTRQANAFCPTDEFH